jgi:hypothetical protein
MSNLYQIISMMCVYWNLWNNYWVLFELIGHASKRRLIALHIDATSFKIDSTQNFLKNSTSITKANMLMGADL